MFAHNSPYSSEAETPVIPAYTPQPADIPAAPSATPTPPAGSVPHEAATLLLYDRNPSSRERLTAFLENSGYHNVISTDSAQHALEIIDRDSPDVILLDIGQADIYDLEPLVAIRARESMRFIPVILLAGSGNEETRLRALELGAAYILEKPVNPRELLLHLNNALSLLNFQDRLAHYDPMTGLPNRAMFMQRLDDALDRSRPSARQSALLHLDLDRFRQVNEGLGHKIGDALLRGVAERLEGTLRAGDLLARNDPDNLSNTLSHLGGDEFSILITRLRQPDDAGIIARRILSVMAEPMSVAGRELYVTPSIGIALFPDDGDDAVSLLKHADLATKQAKRKGGNTFDFFSTKLNQRTLERLSVENALRRATERDELRLYYQPKIDSRSGRLAGVEALLRWMRPGQGLVGPQHFIEIAEESGLIVELGRWALRTACKQAKAWQDGGHQGLHMAVNLSPLQFRQGMLDTMLNEALSESGLRPSALTLELTESAIMTDIDGSIRILKSLKEMGVQLSIDDFGTGFSSLSYLRKFPLDELKIDRTFVTDLPDQPKAVALVTGIIAMAKGLGLRLVAEGVETREQYQMLSDLGCDLCQGYLFSKPVPGEEILPLLGA